MEFVKSFLFELKLAVEADHGTKQEGQRKHLLVVRLVVFLCLEPFEIEENYVHRSFLISGYRLAP